MVFTLCERYKHKILFSFFHSTSIHIAKGYRKFHLLAPAIRQCAAKQAKLPYQQCIRQHLKNIVNFVPKRTRAEILLICGGAGVGVGFVTLGKVPFVKTAQCEYKANKSVKTRLAGMENDADQPEPEFPWKDFLKLLVPEIWYLLGAVAVSVIFYLMLYRLDLGVAVETRSKLRRIIIIIFSQSALAVAIVNIQIPILLGDVVNVVSRFTAEATGNLMDEIRQPALKLISMYGVQVWIS